MIKDKKDKPVREIEIDLTGPDGNAFVLLGYARTYSRVFKKNSQAIIAEMMSGDYDNLVDVFDREFGDYITLYRLHLFRFVV